VNRVDGGPVVELRHIVKRFPGVVANRDVNLSVAPGELHAVVGPTYALGDAAQAQIDLAERRTTGKVMLDPSS